MECSYSDKFSKWEPINTSESTVSDFLGKLIKFVYNEFFNTFFIIFS